jgi:hypothetical protein
LAFLDCLSSFFKKRIIFFCDPKQDMALGNEIDESVDNLDRDTDDRPRESRRKQQRTGNPESHPSQADANLMNLPHFTTGLSPRDSGNKYAPEPRQPANQNSAARWNIKVCYDLQFLYRLRAFSFVVNFFYFPAFG